MQQRVHVVFLSSLFISSLAKRRQVANRMHQTLQNTKLYAHVRTCVGMYNTQRHKPIMQYKNPYAYKKLLRNVSLNKGSKAVAWIRALHSNSFNGKFVYHKFYNCEHNNSNPALRHSSWIKLVC